MAIYKPWQINAFFFVVPTHFKVIDELDIIFHFFQLESIEKKCSDSGRNSTTGIIYCRGVQKAKLSKCSRLEPESFVIKMCMGPTLWGVI